MPIDASSRVARQRVPVPERRAQILDAALECFARRGYHTTTMDDLVTASGLSKGSLYWHFESKLEVFLALFDRLQEELFDGWEAMRKSEPAVRKWMRSGLDVGFQILSEQRELVFIWAEFLSLPEGRERIAGVYRTWRGVLEEIIADGVAQGEFRDVDVAVAATTLMAALEGLALQAMVDPEFDIEQRLDGLWDFLMGGMSA